MSETGFPAESEAGLPAPRHLAWAADAVDRAMRAVEKRAETAGTLPALVADVWAKWRSEGMRSLEAARWGKDGRWSCPACRGLTEHDPYLGEVLSPGKDCPDCGGTGHVRPQVRCDHSSWHRGQEAYILCPCRRVLRLAGESARLFPPILRGLDVATLSPNLASALPLARQEEEIGFLREHRKDGFVFLGPAGTSKSTFAAALLGTAAIASALCSSRKWDWTWTWRVDGREFFEAEHRYVTGDEDARRVLTAEDIRSVADAGFRPVLVLEEVDKRRMTEFNADCLFNVVNAMDECEGQLIMTTNLTPEGFAGLFSSSEAESVRAVGDALCRRLFRCGDKGRWVRNYFE